MSKASMKERNKAIRKAWEKEKLLVQAGKGTRDWTKEQQSDILDPDKGKAYDKQGRAFEGQHMKSASEYPDYQGNPDNIQFLTKDEHLKAHKGSWQNPTNWFYDPVTKEFYQFGEEELIPCAVLELSDPIVYIETNRGTNQPKNSDDLKLQAKKETKSESNLLVEYQQLLAKREKERIIKETEFKIKHPILSAIEDFSSSPTGQAIKDAAIDSIPILVGTVVAGMFSGYSDQVESSTSDDSASLLKLIASENMNTQMPHQDHSSPSEHTVPGHGQHYHTKDGVIWKEKKPYKRGGTTGDNES